MNNITEKKKYQHPTVTKFDLDSEISLTLDSNAQPDSEPNWITTMNAGTTGPFNDLT